MWAIRFLVLFLKAACASLSSFLFLSSCDPFNFVLFGVDCWRPRRVFGEVAFSDILVKAYFVSDYSCARLARTWRTTPGTHASSSSQGLLGKRVSESSLARHGID